MPVQQRDEHQHEPDGRAGQQRLRLPQGQRPGDRGRRRHLAGRDPDLLPPAGEVVPVVPAGQGRVGDHRGGLGQRQRLAAERLDQVDGALALGRVHAEPLGQAVERLADAEEADRDDRHPAAPGGDRGLRAGDEHPAGEPLGPETVQVRHVLQVVQDDQPRLVGRAQPADQARRDRFGRAGRLDAEGRRRGLHVPGEHRGPVGGGDPDQHVDGPGPPQRLGDDHRDLGLAAGAQPVRWALGEGRARHQGQGRARDERLHDAARGIGPVGVSLGQRRHLAHPESLSRLLSRHSSRGHHCPLPPTIHPVSKTSSEYSINNTGEVQTREALSISGSSLTHHYARA